MKKFTCEECLAYCICPQKPKREDYADENKYLIDLECGVWSCKNTVQELCKENGKLKEQMEKMKCCENCAWWYRLPNGQKDCAEKCENLDNWSLRK